MKDDSKASICFHLWTRMSYHTIRIRNSREKSIWTAFVLLAIFKAWLILWQHCTTRKYWKINQTFNTRNHSRNIPIWITWLRFPKVGTSLNREMYVYSLNYYSHSKINLIFLNKTNIARTLIHLWDSGYTIIREPHDRLLPVWSLPHVSLLCIYCQYLPRYCSYCLANA